MAADKYFNLALKGAREVHKNPGAICPDTLRGVKAMSPENKKRNGAPEPEFETKRRYVRAPLYTKAGVAPAPDGPWTEVEVLDISFGGVLVRFGGTNPPEYSRGSECAVKFRAKGEDKIYQGSIVRIEPSAAKGGDFAEAWEAGIDFGELPREQKQEILTVFMWTKLEQSEQ
jgi:hypothetical protein